MGNSKNKGVKKNSDVAKMRNLSFVERQDIKLKLTHDGGMIDNEQEILLALAYMGFRTADFYKLQDTLVEVRNRFRKEACDDFVCDKSMEYTKDKVDRILNSCLPPVMQKTWEERNDLNRHTIGLRIGPAENRPEEVEAYIKARAEYLAERDMAKIKRMIKKGIISEESI